MLGPVHHLLCLPLLCFCIGLALSSPSPPQAAQRDFRPRRHARNVVNPLLSSRQVKADSLREGASKRQSCPTPQVSGGCCPPGKSVCGTICTDTSTDPGNCGTCGTTCISGVCNDGTCCPNNEADICDSVCTNNVTDPLNCGDCETVCDFDQICSASQCQSCQYGYEPCSNTCVSLQDPMNCGSCDNVCTSSQICSNIYGFYACKACSSGTSCGNTCYDLTDDPENCGSCGQACGANQICSGSSCQTCVSGSQSCSNTCVSVADPSNCGSCGNICGSDQICSSISGNLACVTCPSGTEVCDNECISLTDKGNCGACGNACTSEQTCYALPGGPGLSTSYACEYPNSQCEGVIQVWGNGNFYGYLYSVGYNGDSDATVQGQYTWNPEGTTFGLRCGGGVALDLVSQNPVDSAFVFACGAESDGQDAATLMYITGCYPETGSNVPPAEVYTEVETPLGGSGERQSETAIWTMDPDTFKVTASWITEDGSQPETYIVDLGDGGVYLSTDLSVSGGIILTLIFDVTL